MSKKEWEFITHSWDCPKRVRLYSNGKLVYSSNWLDKIKIFLNSLF